jgi:hypothetical protein
LQLLQVQLCWQLAQALLQEEPRKDGLHFVLTIKSGKRREILKSKKVQLTNLVARHEIFHLEAGVEAGVAR